MDGKSIAIADIAKRINDVEQSFDITCVNIKNEFDEVNNDLDICFNDSRKHKRNILSIKNNINWLIAVVACNTTILLATIGYLVFHKCN